MTKLEYGGQVKLLQITIKNLSEMGIDVSSSLNKLNEIKEKVNKLILNIRNSESINEVDKERLISDAYDASAADLNVLFDYLNKYNIYFQTISKSRYLYDSQNEVNYSKLDINSSIDELISCLDSIESFKGLNEEDDDALIESLYKVIYNIIKIEYRNYGKSKLLEYCKNNRTHSLYLNGYVVSDVEFLRNSGRETNTIDLIINKINSEGREAMYLDDELLRTISIYSDKEKYVKDLVNSFQLLISDIEKNNYKISELDAKKTSLDCDETLYQTKLADEKLYRAKTVAKDLLGVVISVTCISAIVHYVPVIARDELYNTDTETFSTVKGYDIKSDEYLKRLDVESDHPDNLTTVVIYEPWRERKFLGDKTYERKVKTVDLSQIELDDIEQYVNFDSEALGYEYDVVKEEKDELALSDLYKESITEITKITQDLEDSKIEEKARTESIVVVSLGLAAIYFLIMLLASIDDCIPFGIIRSIKDMIETLNDKDDLDRINTNLNEALTKLKNVSDELMKAKQKIVENELRYKKIMSVPENEIFLNQFQKGINLLERYSEEIGLSKKLTL